MQIRDLRGTSVRRAIAGKTGRRLSVEFSPMKRRGNASNQQRIFIRELSQFGCSGNFAIFPDSRGEVSRECPTDSATRRSEMKWWAVMDLNHRPKDYAYHFGFRRPFPVGGLDSILPLRPSRRVSTRSLFRVSLGIGLAVACISFHRI